MRSLLTRHLLCSTTAQEKILVAAMLFTNPLPFSLVQKTGQNKQAGWAFLPDTYISADYCLPIPSFLGENYFLDPFHLNFKFKFGTETAFFILNFCCESIVCDFCSAGLSSYYSLFHKHCSSVFENHGA